MVKAISEIDTQIAFPLRHQNYAAYRWSRSLRPKTMTTPLKLVLRAYPCGPLRRQGDSDRRTIYRGRFAWMRKHDPFYGLR